VEGRGFIGKKIARDGKKGWDKGIENFMERRIG
jgi:hypothetical protein